MKKSYVLMTATALLLGACSHTPIPVAQNHAKSYQYTMQAAHHWEVLAAHTAGKINQKLQEELQKQSQNQWAMSPGMLEPVNASVSSPQNVAATNTSVPGNTTVLNPDGSVSMMNSASAPPPLGLNGPVGMNNAMQPGFTMAAADPGFANAAPLAPEMPALHVVPPVQNRNTPSFIRGFHNLLQTHLLQQGLNLTTSANAPYSACYAPNIACKPLQVKYDVQVVHHKDRDAAPIRYPGRYTAGMSVLGGVAYIVEHAKGWDKGWSVLPLTLLADGYMAKKLAYPDETDSEVLITTTVSDGEFLVFSDTSIYYINMGDDDHYERGTTNYQMVNTK